MRRDRPELTHFLADEHGVTYAEMSTLLDLGAIKSDDVIDRVLEELAVARTSGARGVGTLEERNLRGERFVELYSLLFPLGLKVLAYAIRDSAVRVRVHSGGPDPRFGGVSGGAVFCDLHDESGALLLAPLGEYIPVTVQSYPFARRGVFDYHHVDLPRLRVVLSALVPGRYMRVHDRLAFLRHHPEGYDARPAFPPMRPIYLTDDEAENRTKFFSFANTREIG